MRPIRLLIAGPSLSLVERITQAIHECESQEQRVAMNAEVLRWRLIKAVLLDSRDELQRPAGGKRETLTLNPKAAA